MPDIDKEFASALRRRRTAARITQKELAFKLDHNVLSIREYEKGRRHVPDYMREALERLFPGLSSSERPLLSTLHADLKRLIRDLSPTQMQALIDLLLFERAKYQRKETLRYDRGH